MKPIPLSTTGEVAAGRAPSARWALICLSLSMLLSSLGTSITNVGLPTLAKAFAVSFQDVQCVVIAYLLAITALIVSVGRLGDLCGRRRLMLTGIALFSVASLSCGTAAGFWPLIAARVAQGLGAAIMMALTLAFVGEAVPRERTGSAMGLLGTLSAIGTALGPTLGGVLIAGFGWQALFLINVPLGLLLFVLAWRHLPAVRPLPKAERPRFDLAGTLLLAGTLAAYALAMTLGQGQFGLLNLGLLLAAMVGVGLFLWVEQRAAFPLVRLAMFRTGGLSRAFAMSLLVATVMMATLVVGPFYLSGALGLAAAEVGLVMSCGPLVAALAGVPAGQVVDRFGAPRMTLAGLAVMLVGAGSLPALATVLGVVGYLAPLTLITSGYALFQVANNTAVMVDIPTDQRGVTSGLLNLSRNLGLITGASVMGAVFAFGASVTDISRASPHALSAGLALTFAIAAVLVLVALIVGPALSWCSSGRRSRNPAGLPDET